MLYLFWGPNDFSLRGELAKMRDSLGPPDMVSLNYIETEASALGTGGLAALAQTMPFLGEKRLIVVRGLLAPFEPRQKAGSTEGTEAGDQVGPSPSKGEAIFAPILEVLSHLPPTTDLVLVESRVSPKNALFSRLPQGAIVREFPLPAGAELERWIIQRAKDMKGTINPAAARLLSESIGPDLWMLDSELQKLLLYTSDQPIGESEVRLLVSQVREANVFALVDAVMASRPGPALGLTHQLLDGGTTPSHLLILLARQIRLLLMSKDLTGRGLAPKELAEALGFRSPWAANKLAKQAEGYSYERLADTYRRVVEEDLALKTGKRTPEVGLDLLVMELCSAPARR
ncbi:MAG: DNA polymerase III subunit delta [Dehalococcoidia bacterium]|nr:DNA polymerase III subunit delta [Dehalococcoidia bacterium]